MSSEPLLSTIIPFTGIIVQTQNFPGGFIIQPLPVIVTPTTVPNVIGKDWEEAEQEMVRADICTSINGPTEDAIIKSQSINPGTSVERGTKVTMERVKRSPI